MSHARPRLPFVALVLTALVLGLTGPAGPAVGPAAADHAGAQPGPVHAGSTFGWGHRHAIRYREEFKGRIAKRWAKAGRGQVRHQHGMLTLNTRKRGSVSALRKASPSRTGRWEVRLRSRRYETAHTDYRVMTELVPRRPKARRCGANNIALETYRGGKRRVGFHTRSAPDHAFTAVKKRVDTTDQNWHTYAVEVRPKKISWFVDAHVIRTEKRPAALSGKAMTVRFTMKAVKGKRMNKSRMQMDWLRHWSLKSPNKKSTKAPRATKGTYAGGC